MEMILHIFSFKRIFRSIIKKENYKMAITKESTIFLRNKCEEFTKNLISESIKITRAEGRITLYKRDIENTLNSRVLAPKIIPIGTEVEVPTKDNIVATRKNRYNQ